MGDLSKLSLKGHFEQLRSEAHSLAGSKKAFVKAQEKDISSEDSTHKLLELLIKAVAIVEEIHATDADFLHGDHASDYQDMIRTLNEHGISYKGNQEIFQLDTSPNIVAEKKPMQKAGPKKAGGSKQNKKAS